mmetsp:Transcript_13132/g.20404  ORF Transcript_13132/g.20404 Transcript_13132/m.20404 type:complete len:115 (+) Transcript_13132:2596-2940(+)
MQIKLSDTLTSFLVSKVLVDARFGALDQGVHQSFGIDFQFLRVRNSQVFRGHSPQFKDIIIINSSENDLNLIFFTPATKGQITLDTMHENVKNSLRSFEEDHRYDAGDINVWLP